MAQDDFLPRPFATFGRRLVSSVGIVYLALTAGLLLTVFDGITDRLIPLFAIGAFLTFTMSQTGMVVHWRRELRDERHTAERRRLWINLVINAIGASTTVTALVVIVVAKFAQGGWITIVAIPGVILLHKAIKRYYDDIDDQLRDEGPLEFHPEQAADCSGRSAGMELNDRQGARPRHATIIRCNGGSPGGARRTGRQGEERKLREQWAEDVEEARARPRIIKIRRNWFS